VNKLRSTLGDCAAEPRFIETVGRGYRFIAPVAAVKAGEMRQPVEIPSRPSEINSLQRPSSRRPPSRARPSRCPRSQW
jgi:DNA-binding winged helix-turn-helix (wHTH) protein